MTFYAEDAEDELDPGQEPGTGSGHGSRVATWIIVGALALIAVNAAIAALGGKKPAAVPTPVPVVTVRPTAPAVPTPSTSTVPVPEVAVVPVPVAPSLPLPSPQPGPPAYPLALGALTVGGDIVLLDGDNGQEITTLVPHEPGLPVREISWDAERGIMYFDRGGECPTVWRYRLEFGRPELFANGSHPVVSPDGTQVAVVGTGCGPGNAQSDGVALYDALTGRPGSWIPSPSAAPTPFGRLRMVDVDWRPDGAALAVTLIGVRDYVYKLVPLKLASGALPADLGVATDIPMLYEFRERFYQLEYVGQRLLLVGHCCFGESKVASERLVLREPADALLTSQLDTTITSVTADRRGQVRYVAAEPDGAGRLHSVVVPDPGQVAAPGRTLGGGLYLTLDW